jgi:hypothetical protein
MQGNKALSEALGQAIHIGLEVVKLTVGSSIRME